MNVSTWGGNASTDTDVGVDLDLEFEDHDDDGVPPGFRHGLALTIFICVAYVAVFVVGVVGNTCVVVVVWRLPRMRSTTNLFVANLAVADLLVNLLCLPFTLVANVLEAWVLGHAICKAVPFLQGVSVSASVNTLVCISLERCLAVCWPLRRSLQPRAARMLIGVVWGASLLVTLPWAVVFQLEPLADNSTVLVCSETWPSPLSQTLYFAVAHLSMCYLLPLVCISACYALIWRSVCRRRLPGEPQVDGGPTQQMLHRSKLKAVKMLLVVVVSFALSWLPLYVLFSRLRFGGPLNSELENELVHGLLPFAQWLGTSNSCVNPILYAYFNRQFRNAFVLILSGRPCCCTLSYDYDQYSGEAGRSSRMQRARLRTGLKQGITAIPADTRRRGSSSLRERERARASLTRAHTVCEVRSGVSAGAGVRYRIAPEDHPTTPISATMV